VQLISPNGLSIISDIDDTVKVTGIPEGQRVVINNVFFASYKAAPCMAELYRSFSDSTAYHYVSGGPWQLYEPLSQFLFSDDSNFPQGSVHMKNVRTNLMEKNSYKDFWKLAGVAGSATVVQKTAQIERLLSHFPNRRFILVGDSGEYDPEIFNDIRSRHLNRIAAIKIRDVLDDTAEHAMRLKNMDVILPDGSACQ